MNQKTKNKAFYLCKTLRTFAIIDSEMVVHIYDAFNPSTIKEIYNYKLELPKIEKPLTCWPLRIKIPLKDGITQNLMLIPEEILEDRHISLAFDLDK